MGGRQARSLAAPQNATGPVPRGPVTPAWLTHTRSVTGFGVLQGYPLKFWAALQTNTHAHARAPHAHTHTHTRRVPKPLTQHMLRTPLWATHSPHELGATHQPHVSAKESPPLERHVVAEAVDNCATHKTGVPPVAPLCTPLWATNAGRGLAVSCTG